MENKNLDCCCPESTVNCGCILEVCDNNSVILEIDEDNVALETNENIVFGGTTDYEELENKPSINGVELIGNKTTEDLGIEAGVKSWNGQTGDVEFSESDPTVPNWAKAPTKPTYTASEVGALPDTTDIPSKTSDLENDSGFITTETDPTVPAWAKQPTKPSYTANEVGALPDTTVIPSKTSDLTNDSGFIVTETDPTVPSWAKQSTKPSYTPSEVNAMPLINMGDIDLDAYDYDFWEYLNDNEMVEAGFYKLHDIADGFDYFLRIERTESTVYQEWWGSEEGSLARHSRSGFYDGEEWNFADEDSPVFSNQLDNYYRKSETYSKTEVDNKFNNYYTDVQIDDILDNNYYTSDQVDELLEGFAPENMISTTWANLVSLRDAENLVVGAYYRITDYNFITSKLGVQSGNHPFDIVVLAISESMLSESAYAVRHQGDHYFEREITTGGIEWLYSIYVDDYAENYGDEPVDHADDIHAGDMFCDYDYLEHPNTGDIVPVLYKTDINEYDFDDPDYVDAYFYDGVYDFDGDDYDMWSKWEFNGDDWEFVSQYALTPIVVEDDELIVSPIPETKTVPVNMNAWELKYCLDNDKELFAWADTNGKGVIYYLKDEFGNEAPYDFKNVKYARRYISAVSNTSLNSLIGNYAGETEYYGITTTSQVRYYYTFDDGTMADASLFGTASYNIINTWIDEGQKQLNNIVTENATNSTFQSGAHNITIVGNCRSNTVKGDNCLFYGAAELNGIFRYCTIYNVTSLIAEGALRTSLGASVNGVKILGTCYDINFGNNLSNCEMSGGCFSITFGNYCSYIKIGNGCNTITFGNYCINISIGASCNTITFTNYWKFCEIMDSCSRINLQTTSGSTSNYCQFITIRRNVSNVNLSPTRKLAYETIYYKTGKVETPV